MKYLNINKLFYAIFIFTLPTVKDPSSAPRPTYNGSPSSVVPADNAPAGISPSLAFTHVPEQLQST